LSENFVLETGNLIIYCDKVSFFVQVLDEQKTLLPSVKNPEEDDKIFPEKTVNVIFLLLVVKYKI